MNTLKILIEGYVKRLPGGVLQASPSTVIINTAGKMVLVDPGANPELLRSAMQKYAIKPENVDALFLTHYHPDHILNIRLFPLQEILDGATRYLADTEIPYNGFIPGTDIEVVPTPGHSAEHASLIVNTAEGKFAIAGDLFWWEEDQRQKCDRASLLKLIDPLAQNVGQLYQSRVILLEKADFFIPGHGKMFRVSQT